MLHITDNISIRMDEITLTAIRSQGPGGQNVNKVASAIQLRFEIEQSSLPDYAKARLKSLRDNRITSDGVIIIKAQTHRLQSRNREDALARLAELIRISLQRAKIRRPIRPTRASKERRLAVKSRRGQIKNTRGAVRDLD